MSKEINFPWYDSPWLHAYVKAKEILQQVRPSAIKDFEEAMQALQAPSEFKTKHLAEIFSTEELDAAKSVIVGLQEEDFERHELMSFGRMVIHDHPELTLLQHKFTERVSELAEEELEVSYNFLSLYNNLGVCQPHMDAPSAKWTLDICLEQSAPWPISFSQVVPWPEQFALSQDDWREQVRQDPALQFSEFAPEVNEALFFAGANQWHYRDRLPRGHSQNFCHLLFFHYIPIGCRDLVEPDKWWQLFDVPELKNLKASRSGTSA